MIKISQPILGKEEKKGVLEVLESGNLAQGDKVNLLEEQFAKFINTKYAVATSNGTTALHLSLLALGIGKGDEVITTPFTFIASSNAIIYCEAKPVFVDIDPYSFNIDTRKIEERITKKTKAILVVHLFGLPTDMPKIRALAKKYNIFVIEDACQAHGASINNNMVGSLGDVGCFSFYPTKNMTTGEGGMITTNSKSIANRARLLREHGMKVRYRHDLLGYNFRMTNITAAIGLPQLSKLDFFNQKRIKNAAYYLNKLSNIPGLILPYTPIGFTHVYHQFTLRITKRFYKTRSELINNFTNNLIGYGIYYPIPVHKQKIYKALGFKESLPISEQAAREVFSIPVHPQLTQNDLAKVVETILTKDR